MWHRTFNVNVLAQFNILRAFLPYLLAAKQGHIITMSSLLGRTGCAQVADYAASKAALISLHESLRQELDYHYKAPHIRTTLLTPGLIHTPMFSGQRPLRENSILPGWLFDFLMPALPPHAIVKEMIKALDEQESRDVILPEFAKTSLVMPILPYWLNQFSKWVGSRFVIGGLLC
jgi:short-subunit dehydrogenase